MKDLINNIPEGFSWEFDKLLVEGLKRKGFVFKDRMDLQEFARSECSTTEDILRKERTFYVRSKPFFMYKYEQNVEIGILKKDGSTTITAIYGYYTYL